MAQSPRNQRSSWLLSCEQLETRLCLTGISFASHEVFDSKAKGARSSVYAADLDDDGDMDVLTASWAERNIVWYENISVHAAGDANQSGEFDQDDIVLILQSSRYLTGEHATWEQGDWNDDGVFDQVDLILALETNSYLRGPH